MAHVKKSRSIIKHLSVNNNDNFVEVRKIKLRLLRVSILLKENSAQDKKSICAREKIGIKDNLSKKKEGGLCKPPLRKWWWWWLRAGSV